MSQGRPQSRHQRAPARRLSDAANATRRRQADPLRSALRIGPPCLASAADWHERGVRHECDGDGDAAVTCYRIALQTGGPDAQIVFDLAYALAALGQTDRAIERYLQALELDPGRADAWVNLGDLLAHDGQAAAAADAFRQAVRLDPADPVAHYGLADALDAVDPPAAAAHWAAFLALAGGPVDHLRYASHRLRATQSQNPSRST